MDNVSIDTKKGCNPFFAVKCFFQGLSLLRAPELRQFLVIPLTINVILYLTALGLGYFYVSDLIGRFIPGWLEWLSWLIWPVFFVSFFMVGFFTFTLLANLLAAPFYESLAAKAALLINASSVSESNQHTAVDSFLAEVKRQFYLVIRALPILAMFLIPGINVIASVLWMLFGAWSMALEYLSFPLENAGMLFPSQRQLVKSIRPGALAFGGIVMVGLTLPVLNIVVPPAAVIGGAIFIQGIKTQKD